MKTVSILVGFVAVCLSGISTASASTLFSNLGQTEVGFAFLPDTNRVLASDFLTGPSPTVVTGATLKLANPDFLQHTFTASIWRQLGRFCDNIPWHQFGRINCLLAGGASE